MDLIVESWNVEVSIHHHASGRIIFEFYEEDTKIKVMQGGPYMIFGRPLLLKTMAKYFSFEDEDLSCFPVWIQLSNLPLSLWGNSSLAKICSRIGNPISVDKFTASCERVSYARALVEIDVAKDLEKYIEVELPTGVIHKQVIYYENLPKFCSNCRVMGHSVSSCKVMEKIKEKQATEIIPTG